jgi:hypothetical protein
MVKSTIKQEKKLSVLPGKALQAIANSSETAKIVTQSLFLRRRLRTFTNIELYKYDLIKNNFHIIDSEYNQFWQDLQEAGMGVIVKGRTGVRSRFLWGYNMKLVAQAAIEGTDIQVADVPVGLSVNLKALKTVAGAKALNKNILNQNRVGAGLLSSALSNNSSRVTESNNSDTGNQLHLFIMLESGNPLSLKLPNNLTQTDVNTICKSIQSMFR